MNFHAIHAPARLNGLSQTKPIGKSERKSETMFGRKVRLLVMAAAVVCCQLALTATAAAHTLTVTASANCVNNAAVISYTVTSWDIGQLDGTNPEIDIYFNGIKVDAQAFMLPNNQFSGQLAAPFGATTVNVEADAVGTWGDGYPNGQVAGPVAVTVPTACAPTNGRFTGGGKQINVGGVAITKGLTIHCDLLLSNNLEINWGGGHQFHMETHLTALCTDSPIIIQQPPKAPLDTMVGVGIGRFDGAEGYTVEFTLVDAGEPGSQDMAAIKIYETANPSNIVLNLPPTFLTGGNLQAHFDQPHK
jgi:hypothetical protein